MKSIAVLFFGALTSAAFAFDLRKPGEVLGGAIEYTGGFAQLRIPVNHKDVVKSFRLAVPKHCKDDVEVLEAGTVTESQYDEAKLVSAAEQSYAVNGGAGSRISAVIATFNGPKTTACTIPVYLSGKASTPSPAITAKASICNKSREAVWVSLGYHDGTEWKAQGWWALARKECAWMGVPADLGHAVYLHARGATGAVWGKGDATFCVVSEVFNVGDEACDAGKGYWAKFSKLTRSADGHYYLDLVR